MSAHLSLVWSDSLETLAERLRENRRAASSADPFTPTCIVTGNALRKDWLHRQLVQRAPAPERLVANLDFQLLYPFVNDWLFAAFEARPITERKPAEHPYSQQMLRWRIRNILSRDLPRYPALYRYVGDSPQNADTRIFSLAGVLARVFDTYQVRRPEMLHRWETEELPPGAPAAEKWQCQLWRALVQQLPNSYLTQFLALKQREIRLETAFSCGMPRYDSVHVFGVNDLPRPFLLFFKRLAEILPVTLYAFNPSEEMWFDDAPFRAARQEVFRELLDGTLDLEPGEERISREIAERSHPLLGRFALAIQGFLAHLLDELDANQEPLFDTIQPGADTLLGRVRREAYDRDAPAAVEHPVAGRAVAHAAAEVLLLARIGLRPGEAAGYDEAAPLDEVRADADAEDAAHVRRSERPSAHERGSGGLRVAHEGLEELEPRRVVEARVVIHVLRPRERRILRRGAYDKRGLAAMARRERGRDPGGAGAYYDKVKDTVHACLPLI